MKTRLIIIIFLFLICAPEIRAEEIIWQKEIHAGYNAMRGNTEQSQLSLGFFINRNNKHVDEISLKGDLLYSSTNEEADTQKLYGMARYAFSFGEEKRWYNFYKLETDHDRFANVNFRITPSVGWGYWFYDSPELKLMAETGIGLEHTGYRDNAEDSDEIVLTPHAFFEKALFDKSKLTQDLYFYPQVSEPGEYRLRSESAFTVSASEKLALRISLIDEYNSNPPPDTDENDLRFESSLIYSF